MKLRIVAISSCLGLAAAFLCLGGCDAPRTAPRGADNLELHVGRLRQVNPVEIAVLPVQASSGVAAVPLEGLRDAFHLGLVKRRYTPLALAYVDSKVVDASYTPGDAQENAILQVYVTRWADTRWRSNAELSIDAEIYMLDVADPDPTQALWGGKVSRTVSMQARRNAVASDGELLAEALQEFADDVLASLPARDPVQAP